MIQTGIDRFFDEEIVDFGDKRVGLLVHPASVNSKLIPTIEIFRNHDVNLTQLFAPEHGLWGFAQDMEGVSSSRDPISHLPVKSLYGSTQESLKPGREDLSEIDILVCDLQDIGSRYYTFIYTMAYCLQACSEADKEVIVLDRPNPINGLDVEGPLLKKGFESFVGLYPLPVRHGMTIGEAATFFNEEFGIECKLQVIPMKGWKRNFYFDETGLPWIPPSPNMPTLQTALVYPGMCLIEGTNLSEGRGTTKPFELVGAPFIDPQKWTEELNSLHLPGIVFLPVFFKPQFQKWSGQTCGGVHFYVTDRKIFRPWATGVSLLKTIIDLYPNEFQWRDQPYEFVTDIPAIDLLSGNSLLRHQLESHTSLDEMKKNWEVDAGFMSKRKRHLIYDESFF